MKLLIAMWLCLLSALGLSQTLTPAWTDPLTAGSGGFKTRVGPDGSVYVVSAQSPPYTVSLDKYSTAGLHLWHQSWMHLPWNMTPIDMAIDSTGAAVVLLNDAGPSSRVTVEKITSAGAISWSQDLIPPTGATYYPIAAKIGPSDQIFLDVLQPASTSATTGTTVFAVIPSAGGSPVLQTWANNTLYDTPIGMAVNGSNAYVLVNSLVGPSFSPPVTPFVVNFHAGGTGAIWAHYYQPSIYFNNGTCIQADSTGAYITGRAVFAAIYEQNYEMFVAKFTTAGVLSWSQTYTTPEVPPFGMLEQGQWLTLDKTDGTGSVYVGGYGDYPGFSTGVKLWKYGASTGTPGGTGGLLYTISSASGPVVDMVANSTYIGLLYGNSNYTKVSPTGSLIGSFLSTETSVNLAQGTSSEAYMLTKTNLRRFN